MRIVDRTYVNLEAFTGQRNCFALNFAHQAMIQRLVVKQVSGPQQDFKVNLFNSRRPCLDSSQSSGGADPAGFYAADPECYKVLPTQTGTAGEAVTKISDVGYPYRNVDGDMTNPDYTIYLEISPDAASGGATEGDGIPTIWDVNIAGWIDVD